MVNGIIEMMPTVIEKTNAIIFDIKYNIISINFQISLHGIQCAFQSLTIRETSEIKGYIGTERLGQEKKDNKGPKNTKNN